MPSLASWSSDAVIAGEGPAMASSAIALLFALLAPAWLVVEQLVVWRRSPGAARPSVGIGHPASAPGAAAAAGRVPPLEVELPGGAT